MMKVHTTTPAFASPPNPPHDGSSVGGQDIGAQTEGVHECYKDVFACTSYLCQ